MAINLKPRPGLSAPLVNSIPTGWDAQWFRRWITDFLNTLQIASGVSQIIPGSGIAVSPAGGTGAVTISIGASGVITSVVGTANEIAVSIVGTVAALSFPANVIFPAPASGETVVINGTSTTLSVLEVANPNVSSAATIRITAPVGTANTLAAGGSVGISNGTNSGSIWQSSGNQTEFWQFNSGWAQIMYFNTSRGVVVNAPLAGTPPLNLQINSASFSPTTTAGAGIVMQNASSSMQTSIDWVLVSALNGRVRNDSLGNMAYCAFQSGIHYFVTGGDLTGAGTAQMTLSNSLMTMNVPITRTSNVNGWLYGQYNTVETGFTAGCVYALSNSFAPNNGTTNALGSLYGIGYTTSSTTNTGGATIAAVVGAPTGHWGLYVSSSGNPRVFLDSDAGFVYSTGGVSTPGTINAGTNLTGLAGDMSANRGSSSGVIYLGTNVTYLYYTGSVYQFGNGNQVQAGSFNATSDARLKSHVQRIQGALDKVDRLRGVTFQWNAKAPPGQRGQLSAGLIAQDVEQVLPEAVSEFGIGANGEPSHKVLNYDATIGLLVEAIRELKARIRGLEST